MKLVRYRSLLALLVSVVWATTSASAQEGGTISGRVLEDGTQRPLAAVNVVIEGTQRGGILGAMSFDPSLPPRMDTWVNEVSAIIAGYAERQRVEVVCYDDTARSYLVTAPYHRLREQIARKLAEREIAFEISSGENKTESE